MRWLYAALLLGSILVPALWTFDRKLKFYPKLPAVFLSIIIIGAVFIFKDVLFTHLGVWGFNPEYHLGIVIAGMPLEEWLFFGFIPYASIFLHETIVYLKPGWRLSNQMSNRITLVLMALSLVLMFINYGRLYTFFNSIFLLAVLIASMLSKSGIINRFFFTFPGEVVWYNPDNFMGFRIFTVPVEDIGYAFSLILGNLLLTDYLYRKLFSEKGKRHG